VSVRQRLGTARRWAARTWMEWMSQLKSGLHPLNPWLLVPSVPAYWTTAAVVAFWWCLGSVRVWSLIWQYHHDVPMSLTVSSGTVIAVSTGLSAIPLALVIMLGQLYRGHTGQLRVIVHESKAQPSLVASVATCVFVAVIGGQYCSLLALLGLALIAALSCYSILRTLVLLQRPDEYADARGRFIVLRQAAISAGSSHRQQNSREAKEEFTKWGNDIAVDPWFEYFHKDILEKYARIPAQKTGLVDTIDLQILHRALSILQKYAPSMTDVSSPETAQTAPTSRAIEHNPLIVVCHLPDEMIQDSGDALALFRKDILPGTELCGRLTRLMARAFWIDPSEGVSTTIADLRSETRELSYELMQGIRVNDPGPIAEFQRVSRIIVQDVSQLEGRETSDMGRETYFDLLRVLARATDEARCSDMHVDRQIGDLISSFPRTLATIGVETGNPDILERCLWPLWSQCRDALREHSEARETRDYVSWYGILLGRAQSMADPNAQDKVDVSKAMLETRLLLQSLSRLLLESARQSKWDAVSLVAKEISNIDSRPSLHSTECLNRFEELMELLHFGIYACLVDLAVTEPRLDVPQGLLAAELVRRPIDLAALLHVYTLATNEGSGSGSNWGWEPPRPLGEAYFIRTDEVLAYGLASVVFTMPEGALFQEPPEWIAWQTKRLEEAAGGPLELERLLGRGRLLDNILRDANKITQLMAATGEGQHAADQAVASLRKLLDRLQAKIAGEELLRIRTTPVSQETIRGILDGLVQQYDATHEPGLAILVKLGLLSTEPRPSGVVEEHGSFGLNRLEGKEWFLGQEPSSWMSTGKEYADGLLRGERQSIITWLAGISSPVEFASVLTPSSHLDESKGILVLNTNVYLLSPRLKTLVEISQSSDPDNGDPDAFLNMSGKQIPMYQFWVQGMKPSLLFINGSTTAHAMRIPWEAEEGWTLSTSKEIKARLRVLSQDTDAMDRFLKDDPDWLQEEGKTAEAKRSYLETRVWIQVYQHLVFETGPRSLILRLNLPPDQDLE
jgi:hypothetical protein